MSSNKIGKIRLYTKDAQADSTSRGPALGGFVTINGQKYNLALWVREDERDGAVLSGDVETIKSRESR